MVDDPDYPYEREPWCTRCSDDQHVVVNGVRTNCIECNPTQEQVAAFRAEYDRAVAAGEIDPEGDPF